jgi:hypothetical protein
LAKQLVKELVKYQLLAYSSYLESSMKLYKDYGKRMCLRYIKKGAKVISHNGLTSKTIEVLIFNDMAKLFKQECKMLTKKRTRSGKKGSRNKKRNFSASRYNQAQSSDGSMDDLEQQMKIESCIKYAKEIKEMKYAHDLVSATPYSKYLTLS